MEKIVPGAKVQVIGQHGGRATTVTASRVALCPGPWAKSLIEPLLGKISILKLTFHTTISCMKSYRTALKDGASACVLLEGEGAGQGRDGRDFDRLRPRQGVEPA